jgi:uncharacterized protein (DUF1778 family)
MAQVKAAASDTTARSRTGRLGFRVDDETKSLIARAANLEHRSLTDYCLAVVSEAARRTIGQHETLTLSERDRAVFFDTLMKPREPGERLGRAFAAERRRVAP